MQGAKTIALLALVVALSEARTSSPATSTGGSAGGDNTPSPNPWNPWNPTPTTSALNPWPQPSETTTSPPIPAPTTKTPKPPKTTTTEPPAPTETTEAPTSSPAPTTTTTAPPKSASNSGSRAETVAVNPTNATTATPKPKSTKTTISAAVNEPSDESANLPAAQPAATVAASQSTYGKNKKDDSTNSQDGNTKAAAGGGGSLSGLLTIIGVLVGAAVVGIMSIVIVKKHREEEGEDDDDEDWDMQHLEVKSTIPSTRANQHTYEADSTQYQQQRPTYRASEKMMMMADPRMSAPQNMQPVMVAPPQQQPMMQQQQNNGMEFRDTESSQFAMLQQPQEFTDSVQEYSGMSECADAFLDEHVSDQYAAHQAAEQYLAKQQAAENFLEQNGDENDIEGDSERESEMPLGVVDIDEPTPSEAYGHRASEQSLGGMAGMTQQYNDQLYGQPSVDEGQLSIDEEGCSEVDLGASVASGLSSVGDNFMEQQVYNDGHPSNQYVNRASEEVQEGLEFQTDLDEPMAIEPTVEEEATGSTYCDRSSFGVFSVRDASFDSAAQDPRFSQDSTFSVGTDVDIDDHDNANGHRFTELDEEFEV